jgi:hypothetical protein
MEIEQFFIIGIAKFVEVIAFGIGVERKRCPSGHKLPIAVKDKRRVRGKNMSKNKSGTVLLVNGGQGLQLVKDAIAVFHIGSINEILHFL